MYYLQNKIFIIKIDKIFSDLKIAYGSTQIWNLIFKNDTNELIHKIGTDLEILKSNLWLPKGKHGGGRDKSGTWDEYTHTTIYKIHNLQGSIV